MDFNLISKIELITEDDRRTLGIIQDNKEDKMYVSLIVDKKKFKLLRPGEKVSGIITDEDKVLGFKGIVNRRVFGEIPMYEITYKDIVKVQRRDNYRMDCSMPARYSTDFNSEEFNEGIIKDISAGGVRLLTNEKLHIGTKILLIFKFIDEEFMLKGDIVYSGENDSSKGLKYGYGIQFIEITDEKRESIIKNIFILMRKTNQNKKG